MIWEGSSVFLGISSLKRGICVKIVVHKNFAAPGKVKMDPKDKEPTTRRPLIAHNHKKQSLNTWLVPLIIILAVIIFLPRVMDLLG